MAGDKGRARWERRYSRVKPQRSVLTQAQHEELCGEFWTQLIWAAKKAQRGELRASQRALHLYLVENTLRMLQEQAVLQGRKARPLGRRAEGWLTAEQLEGTEIESAPSAPVLLAALDRIAETFASSSAAVAALRGWQARRPDAVLAWLSSIGKARR